MTTIIVFTVLVALAIAAWVLEPDYMAHVPVTVGVCVFDSVRSYETLTAFADFIREKGGGDISWKYLPPGRRPTGCDFYLASPLQVVGATAAGEMEISLLASVEGDRCRSKGIVIARKMEHADDGRFSCIFPHRWAASGFMSAYVALAGEDPAWGEKDPVISFCRCLQCDEEILYSVLYGDHDAGGISEDSFAALISENSGLEKEFTIIRTGLPVTDLVIATDISVEAWKRQGFLSRLPLITGQSGGLLREGLKEIGIDGFVQPDGSSLDFLEDYPDSLLSDIPDYRT